MYDRDGGTVRIKEAMGGEPNDRCGESEQHHRHHLWDLRSAGAYALS